MMSVSADRAEIRRAGSWRMFANATNSRFVSGGIRHVTVG
jgi:hypothetical protein